MNHRYLSALLVLSFLFGCGGAVLSSSRNVNLAHPTNAVSMQRELSMEEQIAATRTNLEAALTELGRIRDDDLVLELGERLFLVCIVDEGESRSRAILVHPYGSVEVSAAIFRAASRSENCQDLERAMGDTYITGDPFVEVARIHGPSADVYLHFEGPNLRLTEAWADTEIISTVCGEIIIARASFDPDATIDLDAFRAFGAVDGNRLLSVQQSSCATAIEGIRARAQQSQNEARGRLNAWVSSHIASGNDVLASQSEMCPAELDTGYFANELGCGPQNPEQPDFYCSDEGMWVRSQSNGLAYYREGYFLPMDDDGAGFEEPLSLSRYRDEFPQRTRAVMEILASDIFRDNYEETPEVVEARQAWWPTLVASLTNLGIRENEAQAFAQEVLAARRSGASQ